MKTTCSRVGFGVNRRMFYVDAMEETELYGPCLFFDRERLGR